MAEVVEFKYADKGNATYIATENGIWQSGKDCSGRYVRESDYLALMHDKLAIEGRVNQLVDNYNSLEERHRRLVEAAKSVTGWDWFEILRYADLQDAEPQLDIQRLDAALAEEVNQ